MLNSRVLSWRLFGMHKNMELKLLEKILCR
jgi:hypothetical protein